MHPEPGLALACSTQTHLLAQFLRCELDFAGKPTDKIIDEYSDEYGFSAKATNSKWVLPKPSVIDPPLAAAG